MKEKSQSISFNIPPQELTQDSLKEGVETGCLNYKSHFFIADVLDTLHNFLTGPHNAKYIDKVEKNDFKKVFSPKPLEIPIGNKLNWKKDLGELKYFLDKMRIVFSR